MDIPLLPATQALEGKPLLQAAPAKLYALLLRLRPIQEGTLMAFSGEMVHAAWLSWLRSAAPDVATWLHEGIKPRLFTCSSLQFPLPLKMFVFATDKLREIRGASSILDSLNRTERYL